MLHHIYVDKLFHPEVLIFKNLQRLVDQRAHTILIDPDYATNAKHVQPLTNILLLSIFKSKERLIQTMIWRANVILCTSLTKLTCDLRGALTHLKIIATSSVST